MSKGETTLNCSTRQILPMILSLAFISGCMINPANSDNPSPASPTSPINSTDITGNETIPTQTPVTLNVLGVNNASVDSLTLGKTYKTYKMSIGTFSDIGWENTFQTRFITETGTPSLYIEEFEGLSTLRIPRNLDLSGTTVSRNGKQADKLIYGYIRTRSYQNAASIQPDTYTWYDGLISLFEVLPNEATASEELQYTIGNGYNVIEWNSPYCTVRSSGSITIPGVSCKEINATITVKDSDGVPINNLTRENFEIKNALELPYSGSPGFRASLLEQYETKVTALGQGVYQINQLVPIELSSSGTMGRLRITVSIISKPGTGTVPAQIAQS